MSIFWSVNDQPKYWDYSLYILSLGLCLLFVKTVFYASIPHFLVAEMWRFITVLPTTYHTHFFSLVLKSRTFIHPLPLSMSKNRFGFWNSVFGFSSAKTRLTVLGFSVFGRGFFHFCRNFWYFPFTPLKPSFKSRKNPFRFGRKSGFFRFRVDRFRHTI